MMMKAMHLLQRTAMLATLVFACSALQAAVIVHDGYVRAPVPGQNMAAAFMVISNDGDKPVQLVAVKSDVAAQLELHGHTQDNGIMRMRRIESLPVPAKGEVTLAPGGMHLMLVDLRKPLVEKQQVVFTLVFGDGTEVKAEMPVVSVMDEMPADHAHHH
jgi:copper(I)-binding protein